MPVTPPELQAAMARIEQAGRTDHADSYAGLEVDQEQVRAIVYRVPSATFDDFIRLAAENTCVTVRDAAHAAAEAVSAGIGRYGDALGADDTAGIDPTPPEEESFLI
jgi:hypothetical protein